MQGSVMHNFNHNMKSAKYMTKIVQYPTVHLIIYLDL